MSKGGGKTTETQNSTTQNQIDPWVKQTGISNYDFAKSAADAWNPTMVNAPSGFTQDELNAQDMFRQFGTNQIGNGSLGLAQQQAQKVVNFPTPTVSSQGYTATDANLPPSPTAGASFDPTTGQYQWQSSGGSTPAFAQANAANAGYAQANPAQAGYAFAPYAQMSPAQQQAAQQAQYAQAQAAGVPMDYYQAVQAAQATGGGAGATAGTATAGSVNGDFGVHSTDAQAAAMQRGDTRDISTQMTPELLNQYLSSMDPSFTQGVLDPTLKTLDRNRQMVLGDNNAAAIKAGAFGGSRHGVVDAETNRGFADQVAQTTGNLNMQRFNAAMNAIQQDTGRKLQADAYNQGADLSVSGQNAGFQQQAAIANAAAKLQASGMSAANALAAATANAGYQTQAGIANAGFQTQAGLANAQMGQNLALANAGFQQQANMSNADRLMNLGLFNAGNQQQANLANAGFQQQTNLTNAGWQNDVNAANAGYQQGANQQNAGYQQQAYQNNADRAQAANLFNAGNQQQANLFNAGNQQASGLFNAGNQQQANLANAGFQQQAYQNYADRAQQTALANAAAQNQAGQFNSTLNFNTGMANAGFQQNAQQTALNSIPALAGLSDQQRAQYLQAAGVLSGTGADQRALLDAQNQTKYQNQYALDNANLTRLGVLQSALSMTPYNTTQTTSGTSVKQAPSTPWWQTALGVGGLVLSDETRKKNIRPMKGALSSISKLHGVNYQWKGGPPDSGLIAQDVHRAMPSATAEHGGLLHYSMPHVVGLLAQGVNELHGEVKKIRKTRGIAA